MAGGETYKLGALKAIDFDVDFDMLQVLDPNTTATIKNYSYCSKETADAIAEEEKEAPGTFDYLIGWWDLINGELGDEDYRMDDEDVANGQGFLGLMGSGNEVKIVASGEAPVVSTSIFTDMNESPFIANYLPVDLLLKDISCNDFDVDFDMLQVLDPNTTATIKNYSYCSKETADAIAEEEKEAPGTFDYLIGWWDLINGELGDEDYRMDEEPVVAGAAFLGLMGSGNDVEIMFPSCIKK